MKRIFPSLIITFFILFICSSAFAWAPSVESKPYAYRPGAAWGYLLWHDSNGLHLWATTKGQTHHFSGVIRTNGRFIHVHGRRLESTDSYNIDPDQHAIKFNFTTTGGEDGVDFEIINGNHVNFDLFVDGHRINPNEIYIGDHGWHPEQGKFTLFR